MAQFKFKRDVLISNIEKLQKAFDKEGVDFSIFYSVKTNGSTPVLETVNRQCSFEIVSNHEWEKVKTYKPTELVLNGPSKTSALVKDILNTPVKTLYFNIDNDTDLDIVKQLEPKFKKRMKIGLRLYINRPGIWNRFGFDVESNRADKIVKTLGNELKGVHFHFSTNNFRLENYAEMLKAITKLVERQKIKLSYIDIGGGLPGASDMLYQKIMYEQLPQLIKKDAPENIRIFSEVGRNLVEDVFDLEASIVSVKTSDAESMDVVIDTNIMHFPCFWEKKYDIQHKSTQQKKVATTVNIFGNSCMQIDKIAEDLLLTAKPQVGEQVVLTKMGAYSVSQASNFITNIPEIVT